MSNKCFNEGDLHSLTIEELKAIEETQKLDLIKREASDVIFYNNYSDGSISTTVIIINKMKEPLARGISIMSNLDQLRKIEGRVRARGRALRAMKREKNSAIVKVRNDNVKNEALLSVAGSIGYKSIVNPVLDGYERVIIESLKS